MTTERKPVLAAYLSTPQGRKALADSVMHMSGGTGTFKGHGVGKQASLNREDVVAYLSTLSSQELREIVNDAAAKNFVPMRKTTHHELWIVDCDSRLLMRKKAVEALMGHDLVQPYFWNGISLIPCVEYTEKEIHEKLQEFGTVPGHYEGWHFTDIMNPEWLDLKDLERVRLKVEVRPVYGDEWTTPPDPYGYPRG